MSGGTLTTSHHAAPLAGEWVKVAGSIGSDGDYLVTGAAGATSVMILGRLALLLAPESFWRLRAKLRAVFGLDLAGAMP